MPMIPPPYATNSRIAAAISSSEERSESLELDTYRVIASLGREEDSLLSRIQSIRRRILNLEEDQRLRRETIALRRILNRSSMEVYPDLPDLNQPEMTSPDHSQQPSSPVTTDSLRSPTNIPEPGIFPDITCYEIISDWGLPLNDRPLYANGFMEHPVPASREEHTRNLPMPSSKILGPSGGPDISEKPPAS